MIRLLKSLVYADVVYKYDAAHGKLYINEDICIPFTVDERYTDDAIAAVIDDYCVDLCNIVSNLQQTFSVRTKFGDDTTFDFVNWEAIRVLRENNLFEDESLE